jgi:hypothetical protein
MTARPKLITFDGDGNHLSAPYHFWGLNKQHLPITEFTDTITFKSFERRSSVLRWTCLRENGKTLQFFHTEFMKILPLLEKGKLTGRFTFRKQGQGSSAVYLGPEDALHSLGDS